jgi:hypothetical protein
VKEYVQTFTPIFLNETFRDFSGNARRKETTRKTDAGGNIILKWMLEREDGVVWTGLIWLRIGTSGVFL